MRACLHSAVGGVRGGGTGGSGGGTGGCGGGTGCGRGDNGDKCTCIINYLVVLPIDHEQCHNHTAYTQSWTPQRHRLDVHTTGPLCNYPKQ